MLSKQILFRIGYLLLVLSLFVFLVYLIIQYLFPFVLACIFTLILLPIIRFLHKIFKIPYTLSCGITIFIAILINLLLFFIAGFELLQGIIYLTKWIPEHIQFLIREVTDSFNQWIQPLIQKLNQYLHALPSDQHTLIEEKLSAISNSLADQVANLLEITLNWTGLQIASLPGSMTVLMFSFLCTFFLCKDWNKFHQYLTKVLSNTYLDLASTIYLHIKEKVIKYLKAQFALIFITFIITLFGLLVFQIEHAFTISICLAVVDLLPILGTGIIFVPWALFLFITGETALAICLFSLYLLVMFLRQLLEPKLISSAIGIHPILTILAIYLGFQLFGGVKGIWLGPVILFISKACVEAKLFHFFWNYIRYNQINVDKQ
ncbi:hypothetical protein JCM21714_2017 [Gracilibacillus boraciitolerans JCM 21714]|uniref:Sporulation integral membrane protein YtvI n=1 Tax=Gracilibacillus boraciitolerans JCM 21714 TaxID=1298598 RepID=W4VJK3_9BACI|nr:sporulation integral membrane protein YtvI [Gracilibacillus boraciitolerans]GAE92988.1 hypothetical protein JCM21714_2017 [Gracilibacillus boraciitolerans JCM 21714]